MQFKNLDEIDQEILNLLLENGRMTYVDISKQINLSRVAVKHRVKNLEDEGIIERYTIVVNPEKVGRMVSAFFDMEIEPRYLYKVSEELSKKEQITDVYQMTGSSNLHVHAILELNEDLENFLKNEIYCLDGVKKVISRVIISRIKVRKGLRV